MRQSKLLIHTYRETPRDADVVSQQLMMRAGMIQRVAAGIYDYLPLALRSIRKFEAIVREELARDGCQELLMPAVQPRELWDESGRWQFYGKELLRFKDRKDADFCLGPTHEEVVTDIVRKIISLIEHDFEMKRVRIHMDLDPVLPRTKANENEIAQVILNLAHNAADSMPEGGDLYVSTSYSENTDRIRIDVHDTGCGIKESDRNRVFEPFFTTKEVGKGTGLGLSICYKIVENHLGSIEFDTVTGEGTTFRVYLPVNAEVRLG